VSAQVTGFIAYFLIYFYCLLSLCPWRARKSFPATCYPSYSRGRDKEDHGSKPTQASQDPILKKHKKGLVEWLKV
jgi:hypothetical protein